MNALSIRNLQKVYKNGVAALKGVDLDVEEGEFFGLLGPNGAGKTTLIGILCSLVNKSGGQIKIFDQDIDADFARAKSYLGVVPQEFNFNIFEKVEHIVINQAGFYGIPRRRAQERAEKYLTQLGLWEKRNSSAGQLSGGMKRRLMIARALVHEPRLLILDEPTAGVDIELRRSMWDFLTKLNQDGRTIILTTHYLEEAEQLCRSIAIIDQGRIIENTTTRELIGKLAMETFIVDTAEPVAAAPKIPGFAIRRIDANALEVDVERGRNLNDFFAGLAAAGVGATSMRNKTNRLEELFVRLTEESRRT